MRPIVAALHLALAVANIPTKVGAKAWAENFETLTGQGDIFGINEAGSPRAKRVYRREARRLGFGYRGLFISPNPVFWDKRLFALVSSSRVTLHGPAPRSRLRRLFPGFNAARYCTIVTLRPKRGGPLVTVLCFHFAAGGRKVDRSWRNRAVAVSMAKVDDLIARHLRAGHIVVPMGDANRRPWSNDDVTWLHDDAPDILGIALPARAELLDRQASTFRITTDHHNRAKAASVTVKQRRAA